jgi:hypothetical protein
MKKNAVFCVVLFFLAGLAWAQSIQVSTNVPYHSPNNKACKGKTYSISWTAEGHSELIQVRLLRQIDGGTSEMQVIGSNLPGSGSLNWTIPNSLPSGYGYFLDFKTMAGRYRVSTGMFYIQLCLQPAGGQVHALPGAVVGPSRPPVHAMVYEQFEQGAIRMDPPSLTVRWGSNTLAIGQNEEKWINIDEDSELIDPATGGLRATVEYTLRNTMAKNFRFHVTARFGSRFFSPAQQVSFVGLSTRRVVQNVILYPGNQTLPIMVEATDILIDGGSNDVRPVYFNGKLHVRIFPN